MFQTSRDAHIFRHLPVLMYYNLRREPENPADTLLILGTYKVLRQMALQPTGIGSVVEDVI